MAMHGDGDTALMAVLTVEFVHSLMRILECLELLDGNQDTVRVTATEPWQSQDLHQLLERSNPRSHQMLGVRVLVLAALQQRAA